MDTHEGITIKALLDSSTTEIFMDKRMVARHGFKLQKLERPLMVKNVDGTVNSGGAITLKGAKGTISLAQARDAVPGPNCMLKSLWG